MWCVWMHKQTDKMWKTELNPRTNCSCTPSWQKRKIQLFIAHMCSNFTGRHRPRPRSCTHVCTDLHRPWRACSGGSGRRATLRAPSPPRMGSLSDQVGPVPELGAEEPERRRGQGSQRSFTSTYMYSMAGSDGKWEMLNQLTVHSLIPKGFPAGVKKRKLFLVCIFHARGEGLGTRLYYLQTW